MSRLGLIKEDIVLSSDEAFVLCDSNGTEQVRLIQIVGNGGSAIAYKAIRNKNGSKSVCIVKEYFPEEAEEENIYVRKKIGDPISITEDREKELQIQKENIERELSANQAVYFDENSDVSNSPYVYHSELFTRFGDASYIVMDTNDGRTLCEIMRQRITGEECLRYLYQLLIIVEHLNSKNYLHGDIKPQNLFVRGDGENQSMLLLDFGTVIKLDDYKVDITNLTKKEIMEVADRMKENESLGSTTDSYESLGILTVRNHKQMFRTTDHCPERARAFIESVNNLSVADDLYSIVEIACELFEKATLDREQRESVEEVVDDMKEKNETAGYHSVAELREDIEVIECILNNGAHPAVLEKNFLNSGCLILPDDFTEELLCDVE